MEKGKAKEPLSTYIQKLNINLDSYTNKPTNKFIIPTPQSPLLAFEKPKPPRLESLCVGVVGRHLEDIIDDLSEVAASFPSDIKMALAAIAKRRKLLNDDVILALADASWKVLDVSGSDVSDVGLSQVVKICKDLRAVDISRCSKLTSTGVYELLQHCSSLEILRWGGCPRSEHTARCSLYLLKPHLKDADGESWEELDTTEITHGAPSLRWLVWPKVDKNTMETLCIECPRIIVNPKLSPLGLRRIEVPEGALQDVLLDDFIVQDINPKTWAVPGYTHPAAPQTLSSSSELPIAEKFRLAFVERDTRLAPKRAKNARQHQRRAEKEFLMTDASAKAIALASRANKSLYNRT